MMVQRRLFVAIPAMDELAFLPDTLSDLANQRADVPFEVWICVNQPESFWGNPAKEAIAWNNGRLMAMLKNFKALPLHVIDKSSKGHGWTGKEHGVGWARKVLFDNILQQASDEDVLVSLDADTHVGPQYLQSLNDTFARFPKLSALSVPYYHPLNGEEILDRAVLRYEIYMRNYWLNMQRIKSPYHFTAIGSAMAFKAGILRRAGGITPMKSGEDFYLMQKLCKMTPIGQYNPVAVFPAGRYSDRVFFGIGPALLQGSRGKWDSYPIYHHALFDEIGRAYQLVPQLYKEDVSNDFLDFLQNRSGKPQSVWQPIRKNARDAAHFVQAFHEKADGLRILQYLRQKQAEAAFSDAQSLSANIRFLFPEDCAALKEKFFGFEQSTMNQLNAVRNYLYEKEMALRKSEMGQLG